MMSVEDKEGTQKAGREGKREQLPRTVPDASAQFSLLDAVSPQPHTHCTVTGCRQWHRQSACWREGQRWSAERTLPGVLLKCECVVAYRCVHVCVYVCVTVRGSWCGWVRCVCPLSVWSPYTCSLLICWFVFFFQTARFCEPALSDRFCLSRLRSLLLSARTNAFAYACRRTDARAFKKMSPEVTNYINTGTCKYFNDKLSNEEIKLIWVRDWNEDGRWWWWGLWECSNPSFESLMALWVSVTADKSTHIHNT